MTLRLLILPAALWLFAAVPARPEPAAHCRHSLASQSSLQFSAGFEDNVIEGEFADFRVAFCTSAKGVPRQLHVTVRTASATTASALTNQALASDRLLASEQYPEAVYSARTFESGANGITAHGRLTLHGVTRPVPVFFTRGDTGHAIVLRGHATVKRLAFGIGEAEWPTPAKLANDVRIDFRVVLETR